MSRRTSTTAEKFVADPRDRFLTPIDPLLRNAKKQFTAIVVFACLMHLSLLLFLLFRDHTKAPEQESQIPVEVVVIPPPQPKPQMKEQPKPQPKEKEKIKNEVARDTAPPPNPEKLRTQPTDKASASPLQGKPIPDAQMKPAPNPEKQAQSAPTDPAEHTVSPNDMQDKPDAEPLDKAAPVKDQKTAQKQKPVKDKDPLPAREKASLAREFAALTQAPTFSVATEAKPSPINGGQCHANPYLCTLYGLIMRQQRYPPTAKAQHIEGTVVVAFWVDERGDLIHQALYKTSGHTVLDDEAVDAIRRAAPFPPPPPGIPHGFIAQMEFPPR